MIRQGSFSFSSSLLPLLLLPLLASYALFGPPAAEEVAVNGDLHTIRYRDQAKSESPFQSFGEEPHVQKIKAKANEICKGSTYEIVEQGKKPSTLERKKDLDPRDTYFVIRCLSPRAKTP